MVARAKPFGPAPPPEAGRDHHRTRGWPATASRGTEGPRMSCSKTSHPIVGIVRYPESHLQVEMDRCRGDNTDGCTPHRAVTLRPARARPIRCGHRTPFARAPGPVSQPGHAMTAVHLSTLRIGVSALTVITASDLWIPIRWLPVKGASPAFLTSCHDPPNVSVGLPGAGVADEGYAGGPRPWRDMSPPDRLNDAERCPSPVAVRRPSPASTSCAHAPVALYVLGLP